MGEFSEWYSTFLTDLPGGGVPMHRRRPAVTKQTRDIQAERLRTADYQSFVRDMHRIGSLQRKKLHSLPELEKSPEKRTLISCRECKELGSKSCDSLPILRKKGATHDSSLNSSVQDCKAFLKQCLHPRTRHQTAQILVLEGVSGIQNGPPLVHQDDRKMFVRKHVEHPEVGADDLLSWQRGLLEKATDGKPVMKQAEFRVFDEDCIDVGLTLLKAKNMVKLLGVREKMAGKLEQVKRDVTQAIEDGQLHSAEQSDDAHIAPDYIWENRKDCITQRKEIKRTLLLHACSKRAKKQLQVTERSLMNEEEWKLDIQRKLAERQERQHRRILQLKWLPVFFMAIAAVRLNKKMSIARPMREVWFNRKKAIYTIQRGYRAVIKRRTQLHLSITALRLFQFKMRCWLRYIHNKFKHKHVNVIKHVLQEYVQLRSVARYVRRFKKNVISCQRHIRAFIASKRAKLKEMSRQWDMVARDIIGDDSGRAWMHRLLNQAKIDSNGKAVNPAEANGELPVYKDEKLLKMLRKMRRAYLARLDTYRTDVRVYKAKVEMYSTMESMGMDPHLIRTKLGIAYMVARPRMQPSAPRAVIRHSVETALKQLGIMDFVDEMMSVELKDKIDKLMDTLCQKFSLLIRNNIKARNIFDEIDEDHSGTLEEEEVKAFLDRLEVKTNYQEARALFVRLDYAGNGSLSFSDFMDRINNFKKHGKDMEKMRSAVRAKSKAKSAVDIDKLRGSAGLDESMAAAGDSKPIAFSRIPSIGRTPSRGIGRTPSIKGSAGIGAIGRTPSFSSAAPVFKRTQSVTKK